MDKIFLDNTACICHLDIQHDQNSNRVFSYRLIPNTNKKKFLFSNQKGCYIDKKNILYDDFVSLDLDSPEKLQNFFKKYGFIYSLLKNDSIVVDYSAVQDLLKRIKELHNLMMIERIPDFDYPFSNALKSIFFILTHPIHSLSDLCNGNSENYIYQWYKSIDKTKQLLAEPILIQAHIPEFIYNPINNPNPRYTVKNMVTQSKEYLYYDQFVPEEGLKNRNSPSFFLNLLYCSMDRSDFIDAMLADILYYLNKNHQIDIPIINLPPDYFNSDLSKEHTTSLKYNLKTDEIINYDFNSDLCKKIDSAVNDDDILKKAVRKLMQSIITKEFNYLCRKINCQIDSKNMNCKVVIPDLLSSLLISISTVLSQDILVRTCAGCGKPFIVPSSNSKKIYHNTACGNRFRQKKHRLKEIK